MTQQRIVDIINATGITQRISWNNIKYDADKAIHKINAYLGANYPEISKIMLSPQHTYSIRVGNKAIPIFPYRYFHTVIIPYIITEILSREEEFTTIYNKYLLELEDGLFEMFQNEFNRIPKEFKQSDDVGIFLSDPVFTGGTSHILYPTEQNPLDQCLKRPINGHLNNSEPLFTFRVHYHVNNDKVVLTKRFTFDSEVYKWGDEATVLGVSENTLLSITGAEVYTFKGWSEDPRIVTGLVQPDDSVTFSEDEYLSDVHLYAIWEVTPTLTYSSAGFIISEEYGHLLTSLTIPDFSAGHPVSILGSDFDRNAPNLQFVKLPSTLTKICADAFSVDGLVVQFPTYDYLYKRPNITIASDAFKNKMEYVYIPYSVQIMESGAFTKTHTFGCEVLDTSIPEGWASEEGVQTWCPANSLIYWGVSNEDIGGSNG